jgi:hypothetical protein
MISTFGKNGGSDGALTMQMNFASFANCDSEMLVCV